MFKRLGNLSKFHDRWSYLWPICMPCFTLDQYWSVVVVVVDEIECLRCVEWSLPGPVLITPSDLSRAAHSAQFPRGNTCLYLGSAPGRGRCECVGKRREICPTLTMTMVSPVTVSVIPSSPSCVIKRFGHQVFWMSRYRSLFYGWTRASSVKTTTTKQKQCLQLSNIIPKSPSNVPYSFEM